MQPLTFEPILKRIRWGGTRLGSVLRKPIGPETDYAESWEIADHGDDQSVVATGPHAGQTLAELVRTENEPLFGAQAGMQQFPLLIKFLDANDWLSLQVHPNDQQAKTYDPTENGKTEAWVILDADPGSKLCVGLKDGVTQDAFRSHLQAGTIEEALHMFEVSAGDCVFVPAGTVHAIGAGVLLAEVQQQSDLTFRIHDWGRMGSDGKPRQLHIEQSLACIDFGRGPVNPITPKDISANHVELVRENYFVIDRHQTNQGFSITPENRFRILVLLEGEVRITTGAQEQTLTAGSTLLVPASTTEVDVEPTEAVTMLEVSAP